MELIDKTAVVAEIERLYNKWEMGNYVHEKLISFISSLAVKEVDVDESARHYLLHEHLSPLNNLLHQADLKTELQYHTDIENAFKAGFELGIKAAQKGE